ncbi:uncharacterized protein LOC106670313 isoform X2 [Cimex lectularius]|uniref:Uncharacterized protein n=1 Tax=Cimex lectularius TaxID=79782 RepID=A0A8I6SMS6_CIMLE|nr:uncharacterized protein LOC106670313 isoform X2 [Cimex lectularius]
MNRTNRESIRKGDKQLSSPTFWDEANSAEKIISASRLKELGKSEAAECLALTVLERMTKQQFSQIQTLESALLKDGVIVTKEMNDILRQIIETSGIEKEMKAVHPRPQEAVLLVIQQILRILNQSCSEIVQVETEDKRSLSVPKRMNQLMNEAKKLGIGDLNLPPIVYANERARLAMIERQIKGKMKLKNLHDKMERNRAPSGLKTDRSLVKKHAEVKKRIRRVISIREKMKAEIAQENKECVRAKPESLPSRTSKEEKSETPKSIQKNRNNSNLFVVENEPVNSDASKPSVMKNTSEDTAVLEVIETALTRKMREEEGLSFCPFTGKIKSDEFLFGLPTMHGIYSGNILNVNIVQVENDTGDKSEKIEATIKDSLINEEKECEERSSVEFSSEVEVMPDHLESESNKEYFTIIKDEVPVSSQGSEMFSKIHNVQYSYAEKENFVKEININSPDIKVSSEPLLPSATLRSPSKPNVNFGSRVDLHENAEKRTQSCKKIVLKPETNEKKQDQGASDSARHIIHLLLNNVFAGRNESPNIPLDDTLKSEEEFLRDEVAQRRCCESVRVRNSRWPFEIKYKSSGGPCSSSKGRLSEEEEQIEEFLSASDVMKEEQISRPDPSGSSNLRTFDFEGLPGAEFDIDEIRPCPLTLEGESSSKWFRTPSQSGDPLVVPVPKKFRKSEAYAAFLLSVFLGVGAMGYFTSTGQHIVSNIVMPASNALEKALNVLDSIPIPKPWKR